MRYRALLLDADDTIFDFGAAEARAIDRVIEFAGIRDARAAEVYSQITRATGGSLKRVR